MNHRRFLLAAALFLAFALYGCGSEEHTPAAKTGPIVSPDEVNGATLTGKVTFTSTPPAPRLIDMSANPQCERTHKGQPLQAEDTVINRNGTLRYVFVWVRAGVPDSNWEIPSAPVAIDQVACMYRPHVIGVMAGQSVQISNSDPVNHNIHPVPQINQEWNDTQSPGETPKLRSFPKPEVMVPIKCNVHPWMRAYVGVVVHPFFAVTDAEGTFTIKGLPPGKYTIQCWQEKLGIHEREVSLSARETKTVDFSY